MKNEMKESIIEKVKKFLKIEDDVNEFELMDRLREYRNAIHPDSHADKQCEKELTEKCSEANILISELHTYLESLKGKLPALKVTESMTLYKMENLNSEIDSLREKIESLELNNSILERKNEELTKELQEKKRGESKEKQNDLLKLYKMNKAKAFGSGAALIISGSITMFSQIEKISSYISKYSPFPIDIMNKTMFVIFIIVILYYIKKAIEYKNIKTRMNNVISYSFIEDFVNTIDKAEDEKIKYFSENDVYNYIYGKKNFIKKIMTKIGLRYYSSETIMCLTNVFIYNLLDRDVIASAYKDNLKQYFSIKEKGKYY